MEDDFLTDEQYRDEFDLSPEEGRILWQGTLARVGYVFGPAGENGSGVFVKTPSGRRALLTAEHVVSEYIPHGMWIGGYNHDIEDAKLGRTRRVAFCERAREVLVCKEHDVALVYASRDLDIRELLDVEEWDPRVPIDTRLLTRVVAAGQPADPAYKTKPRVEEKIIDQMKTLLLWTTTTTVYPDGGLFELLAVRSKGGMPDSFCGMSGGPAFSTTGVLVGILDSEAKANTRDSIFGRRRSDWLRLFLEDAGEVPTR